MIGTDAGSFPESDAGPGRSDAGPPRRGGASDDSFEELADDLVAVFRSGARKELDGETFRDLALRVFGFQFRENPAYGAFCRGRGATPGSIGDWREIPPVPTRAFKHLRLLSGPPEKVDAVFRTSGTTRGEDERGAHLVRDLRLYRESLLPVFRANLLADGARLPLVSLIPAPDRAPDSSLSHMVGVVAEELAAEGGGWFLDPEHGIREKALAEELRDRESGRSPVLLAGTAFSFVHWMDALEREGLRFRLPDGSRIMETGGFKGRARVLDRAELHAALEARTGVPRERIVNEYGMTELLSQLYATGSEPHRGPPWMRTRVLDPVSLDPRAPGEPGLLCHLDLANLGSVAAVLTEDRGFLEEGGGVRILGRMGGAEPRGCSLAMDELLSAIR